MNFGIQRRVLDAHRAWNFEDQKALRCCTNGQKHTETPFLWNIAVNLVDSSWTHETLFFDIHDRSRFACCIDTGFLSYLLNFFYTHPTLLSFHFLTLHLFSHIHTLTALFIDDHLHCCCCCCCCFLVCFYSFVVFFYQIILELLWLLFVLLYLSVFAHFAFDCFSVFSSIFLVHIRSDFFLHLVFVYMHASYFIVIHIAVCYFSWPALNIFHFLISYFLFLFILFLASETTDFLWVLLDVST